MITAGIDLGSVYTKTVLLVDGRLMGYAVARTGPQPDRTAEMLLQEALHKAGARREEVESVVSTGYGRRTVGIADRTISEISAITAAMNQVAYFVLRTASKRPLVGCRISKGLSEPR